MGSPPLSQTSLYYDPLTGLVTIQGWVRGFKHGQVPQAGGLIAIDVVGLGGVNQTFGHGAGDALLREVVTRAERALPENAVLVRSAGTALFAWLPSLTGIIVEAFVSHLRQHVCSYPMELPGGEQILPKLILAAITVEEGEEALKAVQRVQREMIRMPEFTAPPSGVTRAVSTFGELNQRLEAVRLFGRDAMVENILTQLKLPAMTCHVVVLLGPPQAGKSRLLISFGSLLGGQAIPLADVVCRPGESSTPFATLTSLLSRFLSSYPGHMLHQRLDAHLQGHPWLGRLFPQLSLNYMAPPPPGDAQQVQRVLETMLLDLGALSPHVGIIHNLHLADPESLSALANIQARGGHGLRIIACADSRGEEPPAVLHPFIKQGASILMLPPLTRDQLESYLREVTPHIVQPSVVNLLYEITGGLPLEIEACLRSWVADGSLTYNQGRWEYFPEKVELTSSPLNATDRDRLGRAALVGQTTIGFLSRLWRTSEEDALETVERGRILGYLAAEDPRNPKQVRFADADHVHILTSNFTREQQKVIQAEIDALRVNATAQYAEEDVEPSEEAMPPAMPAMPTPSAAPAAPASPVASPAMPAAPAMAAPVGHNAPPAARAPVPAAPISMPKPANVHIWSIAQAPPIEKEDVPLLFDVIRTLRKAGIQYRLYPPESAIARQAIGDVLRTMHVLLKNRPSVFITYDGGSLICDGYRLQRRDVHMIAEDIVEWMAHGRVRTIAIARDVTEDELSRFLYLLVNFSPTEHENMLADRFYGMNLRFIQIQSSVPAGEEEEEEDVPDIDPLSVLEGVASAGASTTDVGLEVDQRLALMFNDPSMLDTETLWHLPEQLAAASTATRQLSVAHLARWMRKLNVPISRNLEDGIDHILVYLMKSETHARPLGDTCAIVKMRLESLVTRGAWDDMLDLVEPLYQRYESSDDDPQVTQTLNAVLSELGRTIAIDWFMNPDVYRAGGSSRARRAVATLRQRLLQPFVEALREADNMDIRAHVMTLLREFGDAEPALLLDELRRPSPWYVYRNLLQVLAENGTESALGAISEKLRHPDPRVRAEAVNAATRIAKDKATPYLTQALRDESPEVRARAAAVAGLCQRTEILHLLLRILQQQHGTVKEEPYSVLLAAVLALGQFGDDERAREALTQILYPGLLSPYRKMGDEIRAAAVTALSETIEMPEVRSAIERAARDRGMQVRQAAQRALYNTDSQEKQ